MKISNLEINYLYSLGVCYRSHFIVPTTEEGHSLTFAFAVFTPDDGTVLTENTYRYSCPTTAVKVGKSWLDYYLTVLEAE